jgi:hypothetical protein
MIRAFSALFCACAVKMKSSSLDVFWDGIASSRTFCPALYFLHTASLLGSIPSVSDRPALVGLIEHILAGRGWTFKTKYQ